MPGREQQAGQERADPACPVRRVESPPVAVAGVDRDADRATGRAGDVQRVTLLLEYEPNDPRVRLRASADWLTVELTGPDAMAFVVELVEAAAAAHRADPGTIASPPPQGADLARWRRFH